MSRSDDKSVDNILREIKKSNRTGGAEEVSVTDILDDLQQKGQPRTPGRPNTGRRAVPQQTPVAGRPPQRAAGTPAGQRPRPNLQSAAGRQMQGRPIQPGQGMAPQQGRPLQGQQAGPNPRTGVGAPPRGAAPQPSVNRFAPQGQNKQPNTSIENRVKPKPAIKEAPHKKVIDITHKVDENFMNFFAQDENLPFEDEHTLDELRQQQLAKTTRERKQQEYLLLKEKRRQKVKRFNVEGLAEGQKPEDVFSDDPDTLIDMEEVLEENHIEEFERYKEAPQVEEYILEQKKGLLGRAIITSVLGVFSLIISLGLSFNLSLPGIINASQNPGAVVFILLGIVICGIIVNYESVLFSFINLFRHTGDSDSLISIAMLFQLLASAGFAYSPASLPKSLITLPIVLFSIVFNTVAKMKTINRILRNFDIISDRDIEKYSIMTVEDKILAAQICSKFEQTEEGYTVAVGQKQALINNFVKTSFSYDYYDITAAKMCGLTVLISVIAGVVVFLTQRNLFVGVGAMAAVAALINPLCGIAAMGLGLSRMMDSLNEEDTVLPSYEAMKKLDEIDTIVLSDKFFFDKDSVTLQGIKTFSDSRIDKIIIYLASVFDKNHSPLTDVFLKVIEHNRDFLVDVEELKYENAMGYSAFIEGQVVLIGNRDLMINHSVPVLKQATEAKFLAKNKSLLYVAIDNKTAGIFVLSYEAKEDTQWYLDLLQDYNMQISVNVTDPGITPEIITNVYEYPKEDITLLNKEIESELQKDENLSKYNNIFVYNGEEEMMLDGILLGKDGIVSLKNTTKIQFALGFLFALLFVLSTALGFGKFFNAVTILGLQFVGMLISFIPAMSKRLLL